MPLERADADNPSAFLGDKECIFLHAWIFEPEFSGQAMDIRKIGLPCLPDTHRQLLYHPLSRRQHTPDQKEIDRGLSLCYI